MSQVSTIKAVGLLSGGLDSILAVKMMIDQGIDVTVVNFVTPFCTCTRKGCKHEACRAAKHFNVPIKVISSGKDYIEMLRNPKHGYGKNMNPCIDCRIFFFQKAKAYMEEIGGSFIFTGEVLGQRPMSQHKKALKLIEKESNLEGLVVRPLSAQLLESTIPELNGWIDRDYLLSIQGRRRLPQMKLADDFGIRDYPCPAGGCRLTDSQFAERLRESFDNNEFLIRDIQLLKYGRHFRFDNGVKVVVGRNKGENDKIQNYFEKNDVLLEVIGVGSPIVLIKNYKSDGDLKKAAALCVRYSDVEDEDKAILRVEYWNGIEEEVAFKSM